MAILNKLFGGNPSDEELMQTAGMGGEKGQRALETIFDRYYGIIGPMGDQYPEFERQELRKAYSHAVVALERYVIKSENGMKKGFSLKQWLEKRTRQILEDAALIRQMLHSERAGRAAINQVYESNKKIIPQLLGHHRILTREDASDAYNLAIVEFEKFVSEKQHAIKTGFSVKYWLFSRANLRAKDIARRHLREQERKRSDISLTREEAELRAETGLEVEATQQEVSLDELPKPLSDGGLNAEQLMIEREQFQYAWEQLNERDQLLLMDKHYYGMSNQEIAEKHPSLEASSVPVTLTRCRNRFRDYLENA